MSEPLVLGSPEALLRFEAEEGSFPDGRLVERPRAGELLYYVTLQKSGTAVGEGDPADFWELSFEVPAAGTYGLRFTYGNDEGPVSTENKTAIRTALLDGEVLGKYVFPQRGGITKIGESNLLQAELSAGEHTLRLEFRDSDENMNLVINTAYIDALELLRLE